MAFASPHESRNPRHGNSKNYTSARVVLGGVDKFGNAEFVHAA